MWELNRTYLAARIDTVEIKLFYKKQTRSVYVEAVNGLLMCCERALESLGGNDDDSHKHRNIWHWKQNRQSFARGSADRERVNHE